jgi:L-iditol 2-dehydrogenase
LSLLPNDWVLVVGQGPIGLLFTRLLKLEGQRVVATDVLKHRVALAKKFGADKTFVGGMSYASPQLPRRAGGPSPQQHPGELNVANVGAFDLLQAAASRDGSRSLLPKRAVLDAAIITAPSDDAVRAAQRIVRGGGKVLIFAHTRKGAPTPIELSSVCVDEKDLLGSYSTDINLQKEVAGMVFSRRLDVRALITHRFPLSDGAAAIALAATPAEKSLKIFVGEPGIVA